MTKLSFMIGSAAVASLLAACSQEPVVRKIELTAEPVVPSGSALAVGSKIQVELENVEPLLAGKRLVVWVAGSVANELQPIGTVVPGEPALLDPASAGVTLSAVRGIQITEEVEPADPTAMPAVRSAVTLLEGAFPGPLAFGVKASDFASAGGSATIADAALDVAAEGLPALPSGFQYVVWLRFEKAVAEAHAHLRVQAAGHDPEPVTNEGMMQIGALPATGTARYQTHDDLFEAVECRVTIESLQGVPEPSPCMTLRGAVELPAGSGGSGEHLH
jgi:hypothetical protein